MTLNLFFKELLAILRILCAISPVQNIDFLFNIEHTETRPESLLIFKALSQRCHN
ncbi:hypothetical protein CKA32_002094 [Geitlerinema sp. FC II]|nr:hypothetical protein CKA32_002094 [Geitlerinema sp. FC II]